jgi:hypothetical protein
MSKDMVIFKKKYQILMIIKKRIFEKILFLKDTLPNGENLAHKKMLVSAQLL